MYECLRLKLVRQDLFELNMKIDARSCYLLLVLFCGGCILCWILAEKETGNSSLISVTVSQPDCTQIAFKKCKLTSEEHVQSLCGEQQ